MSYKSPGERRAAAAQRAARQAESRVFLDEDAQQRARLLGERIEDQLARMQSRDIEGYVHVEKARRLLPLIGRFFADQDRVIDGITEKLEVQEVVRGWLLRGACEVQYSGSGPSVTEDLLLTADGLTAHSGQFASSDCEAPDVVIVRQERLKPVGEVITDDSLSLPQTTVRWERVAYHLGSMLGEEHASSALTGDLIYLDLSGTDQP